MHEDTLAALIGSRICHDLVSPLGAIGNGVELLGMTGASSGPEMDLITQSVQHANAKLSFFRLAFGAHGEALIKPADVRKIIADYTQGTKNDVTWAIETPLTRSQSRLALLGVLCLETALPFGGMIEVSLSGDVFCLYAKSERLVWDDALWKRLYTRDVAGLTAAQVQFGLLAKGLPDLGRHATIVGNETERVLRLAPA